MSKERTTWWTHDFCCPVNQLTCPFWSVSLSPLCTILSNWSHGATRAPVCLLYQFTQKHEGTAVWHRNFTLRKSAEWQAPDRVAAADPMTIVKLNSISSDGRYHVPPLSAASLGYPSMMSTPTGIGNRKLPDKIITLHTGVHKFPHNSRISFKIKRAAIQNSVAGTPGIEDFCTPAAWPQETRRLLFADGRIIVLNIVGQVTSIHTATAYLFLKTGFNL